MRMVILSAREGPGRQDSGAYWAVRGPDLVRVEPSDLARDSGACRKLWDDSARMTALAPPGAQSGSPYSSNQ